MKTPNDNVLIGQECNLKVETQPPRIFENIDRITEELFENQKYTIGNIKI